MSCDIAEDKRLSLTIKLFSQRHFVHNPFKSSALGLAISLKSTDIIVPNKGDSEPNIHVDGQKFLVVNKFLYLVTIVHMINDLDDEIFLIKKARDAFAKLEVYGLSMEFQLRKV
ncbi:Hypothetical predicted protein [Octopus vulgaris]|uniref:Uncharacterized protein n=1 Tax=Octopus vulgaris TaxID=6645 RepID=A0AA36AWR9_OCTVU|nr:Hypothetical predicted protein [Octopus vulgaris]